MRFCHDPLAREIRQPLLLRLRLKIKLLYLTLYVGNLIEVARYGGLRKAFVEYDKRYGNVYTMYLGRSPMITVVDPELLKHILVKHFEKFRNRPDLMRSNPPLESNLFAARDEQWEKVRSLLTLTFSSSDSYSCGQKFYSLNHTKAPSTGDVSGYF